MESLPTSSFHAAHEMLLVFAQVSQFWASAVVTVSAGTGAGPLVVDLTGVSRSAGGRIGLAAVVLR